jgi:P-type E1-E2 ATPase
VVFSALTRLSGVDLGDRIIRKGAVDAILKHVNVTPNMAPAAFRDAVDRISRTGGTPLAVAENGKLLGVIQLKDVVKSDIKERFNALRHMGIKTVMVTGDNPVTAAAIASEAGVDDFIAEATPEDKLAYIRAEQARAGSSRCAATAPMTRRRSPRPMSASPCSRARKRRAKPATWSISTPIPPSSSRSWRSASSC